MERNLFLPSWHTIFYYIDKGLNDKKGGIMVTYIFFIVMAISGLLLPHFLGDPEHKAE